MEEQSEFTILFLFLFDIASCTQLAQSPFTDSSIDDSDSRPQKSTKADGIESKSDLGVSEDDKADGADTESESDLNVTSNGTADGGDIESKFDSGGSSNSNGSIFGGGNSEPADHTDDVQDFCPEGFQPNDDGFCVDIDECEMDNGGCGDSKYYMCINNIGAAPSCQDINECDGDGVKCKLEEIQSVLLYHEQDTWADEAITSLGFYVIDVKDSAEFDAAYDEGGFQMIVWEAASDPLPSSSENRIAKWVENRRRLIFEWSDLDTSTSMQSTLGVSAVSYNTAREVYDDPSSPVSFFTDMNSPLRYVYDATDYGDELTVTDGGFIAARLDSTSGPGTIAVTNENSNIINGFLPFDLGNIDEDGDSKPDIQELYENEIAFLADYFVNCTPSPQTTSMAVASGQKGNMFDIEAYKNIIINLGMQYKIDKIVMNKREGYGYRPEDYIIKVSNDNFVLDTRNIIYRSGQDSDSITFADDDFTSISARYVRVYSTSAEYINISQFEVFSCTCK